MGRHRLNKDRQKSIQGKIADLMRVAEPTAFVLEGPCRAGIRANLCLQGWSWGMADVIAADIVLAALNMAGARRPNWYEGQPEWTQPGALPIHRDRCKRCRAPIPDGRRVFCCYECKQWHHSQRAQQAHMEERRAYLQAWRAAKKREAKCA